MPRVTHIKSAQQRYESVPVIDPETGQQKKTPVMDRRTGEQKKTKTGRLVFLSVTKEDRDRPKPNLRCDYPGCAHPDAEIKPGQPYMHITPKSGPYGGRQKSRHADHPAWRVWEYSSALHARIAEIEDNFASAMNEIEDPDGFESVTEDIAGQIEDLASEKEESASSLEDGFGHPTEVSERLSEQAEALNSWADEVRSLEAPEEPTSYERWFIRHTDGHNLDDEGYADENEAQADLDSHLAETDESEGDWEVVSEDVDAIDFSDLPDDVKDEWLDEARQTEMPEYEGES